MLELGESILPPWFVGRAERNPRICEVEEALIKVFAGCHLAERVTHVDLDNRGNGALPSVGENDFLNPCVVDAVNDAPPGHEAIPFAGVVPCSSRDDIFH